MNLTPTVLLTLLACGAKPTSPELAASPAPALPPGEVFEFEDSSLPGFHSDLNGGGGPSKWEVVERTGAPSSEHVVAQVSAEPTGSRYPLLVLDSTVATDVDLSVSFKTISGSLDASGGLMFRYQDANNFYVVRANALEDNVVAYKTENGARSNIGVKGKSNSYGVKVKVPHNQWGELRVIARGPLFEVYLNKQKLFEVEDHTFTQPGKVGLWTKADSVTEFDDLRVATLKP